ncbi:MAG: hypothetical protein AAF509_06115 [Pseudomonadota bacterium]
MSVTNLQIQFHGEYPQALPSNERAKVVDFYAARDNTTPPLPWPSIAPPFTKTARIDALIVKKRALLEGLAEKRQALITRAVTRGLNPDAH